MSATLPPFCPHCEAPLRQGAAVCTSCGHPVGAVPPKRDGPLVQLSPRSKFAAGLALLGCVGIGYAYSALIGAAGMAVLVILFLASWEGAAGGWSSSGSWDIDWDGEGDWD